MSTRVASCGHCKKPGHYRPRCPERGVRPLAQSKRVREVAARHPAPSDVAPRPAGPWSLVAAERHSREFVARFTWDHIDGRRVTAAVPIPASGDPLDTTEGLVALRRPLDVFAHIRRAMPSAHVEVTSAAGAPVTGAVTARSDERSPAPRSREVVTDSAAWGMW